jgi:CheY-like chemotaxis protein
VNDLAIHTLEKTREIQVPGSDVEVPNLCGFVSGNRYSDEISKVSIMPQKSVLVVEDDSLYRVLIADILSEIGYQVYSAEDGEIALAIGNDPETAPIDLLLTDVVMPNLDGIELSRRFLAVHPNARALFVSAYALDYCFESPMLSYGTGYISKPFNADSLIDTVEMVLRYQ